jgi:hypothetical protein
MVDTLPQVCRQGDEVAQQPLLSGTTTDLATECSRGPEAHSATDPHIFHSDKALLNQGGEIRTRDLLNPMPNRCADWR